MKRQQDRVPLQIQRAELLLERGKLLLFESLSMSFLPLLSAFPQSGSIVSRWKLNEESGSRADSVASNTLTDNNTVTSAELQCTELAGDFEKGSDEYLSITDGSQSGLSFNGNFSAAMWLKNESATSSGEGRNIFAKWSSGGGANEEYFFTYRNLAGTNQFRVGWRDSSSNFTDLTYNTTLSAGSIYHVAISCTVESDAAKISLNGAAAASMTLGSSAAAGLRDGSGTFAIGTRPDLIGLNEGWDGLIQDLVVWNVALTDAELDDIYGLACSTSAVAFRDRSILRGVMRGVMRP
jgi:hypothetical protein